MSNGTYPPPPYASSGAKSKRKDQVSDAAGDHVDYGNQGYPAGPQYNSPSPPYQDQAPGYGPQAPPMQAQASSIKKKSAKDILKFVLIGFATIFLGRIILLIAGIWSLGGATKFFLFLGDFLRVTGALGCAVLFIFGAISVKDSKMKLAMILSAALLVGIFL